eukprot:15365558-Ditylum_brightwellii.AAC.1
MEWNVKSEDEMVAGGTATPADFINLMDTVNYVTVALTKPMGITFEENDEEFGGIFVLKLTEGGIAITIGSIQPGYQLVAVGENKVGVLLLMMPLVPSLTVKQRRPSLLSYVKVLKIFMDQLVLVKNGLLSSLGQIKFAIYQIETLFYTSE